MKTDAVEEFDACFCRHSAKTCPNLNSPALIGEYGLNTLDEVDFL